MKVKLLLLGVCLLSVGCNSDYCESKCDGTDFADSQYGTYICRHMKNYNSGYIVSRQSNPDIPGTTDVYDAEDFRAGALAACNEIQQYYGKDLCTESGYWGIVGPRVSPEQSDSKLNAVGL